MADPIQGQPGLPTPAPAPAKAQEGEKILGKFASQDDLVKAYQEAESKISEYGSKYKNYDDYSKIGPPEQITEALNWARQVKAAMEKGELVPKGTAPTKPASTESAPWDADDWAYKSAGEQAKAIAEHNQSYIKNYVDGLAAQYGKQIEGFRQVDGREKSILMQVLKTAIKNPSVDPESLLQEAAEMAAKSPEQLLELVMSMKANSPDNTEKEVQRRVAEQLATKQQEWEKSKFNDITVSKKPRFGPSAPNREAENRNILDTLSKQGIRLL